MNRTYLGQRVRVIKTDALGTVIRVNLPLEPESIPLVIVYLDNPIPLSPTQSKSKPKTTHICVVQLSGLESVCEPIQANTQLRNFATIPTRLRDTIFEQIESTLHSVRLAVPSSKVVLGSPYGDGALHITYDPENLVYMLSSTSVAGVEQYCVECELNEAIDEFISFFMYGFFESYKAAPKKKAAAIEPAVDLTKSYLDDLPDEPFTPTQSLLPVSPGLDSLPTPQSLPPVSPGLDSLPTSQSLSEQEFGGLLSWFHSSDKKSAKPTKPKKRKKSK
jgi:hypothetical protein